MFLFDRAMIGSDRQIFARVLDTTTSTVIVDDPESLVYSALNAVVQGFVIVDLKASLLGIEASSTYASFPVYDVNTDTTSIVAASAIFNSGMVGMAFYPDSTSRNAYEIVGYVSSTNIIVAGNVNKVDDLGTTMQVCRRGIITEESGRVLLDVDAAFTSPMSGWRVELNLEKPAILNLGGPRETRPYARRTREDKKNQRNRH